MRRADLEEISGTTVSPDGPSKLIAQIEANSKFKDRTWRPELGLEETEHKQTEHKHSINGDSEQFSKEETLAEILNLKALTPKDNELPQNNQIQAVIPRNTSLDSVNWRQLSIEEIDRLYLARKEVCLSISTVYIFNCLYFVISDVVYI